MTIAVVSLIFLWGGVKGGNKLSIYTLHTLSIPDVPFASR